MAKHGDDNSKLELYKKFLPCIKGFGKKLYYEESETDLTIYLLEFINKLNVDKFKNRSDGEIVNYMHSVFKNKFINIVKQKVKKNIEFTNLETNITYCDNYENLETENILKLIKSLNIIQKNNNREICIWIFRY